MLERILLAWLDPHTARPIATEIWDPFSSSPLEDLIPEICADASCSKCPLSADAGKAVKALHQIAVIKAITIGPSR
jgi:hypothetical protein